MFDLEPAASKLSLGDRKSPIPSAGPLIEVRGLSKSYRLGDREIPVLRNLDLSIREGESLAIMGASGSGKSTLLQILGCLDRATSGEYLLGGSPVAGLSDHALSVLRADQIGFVFQRFYLLPQLTVLENVSVPFLYSTKSAAPLESRAIEVLEQVGLGHRARHRPSELSGGEMQRVAIARALVCRPRLILADEPTGNLDSETGLEILRLLERARSGGATVLIVTHDPEVAARAKRVIRLRDGRFDD